LETSPARARATLVATVTTLPAGSAVPMVSDLEGVDWLEIRADLVGDLDAARLARVFPGKLLYTLRSRAEGAGPRGHPSGAASG
jgi:3-dehydroquinate dehydratase